MYGMDYQPPRYRCQKHGVVDVVLHVTVAPKDQPTQSFRYCQLCYNEFLAKNIHQLEDIKDETLGLF